METIISIALAIWEVIEDSAIYILAGFTMAGLIKVFIPLSWAERYISGNGVGAVARASIIGAPLPLCSCSVLPAAMTLRNIGASKGATSAFMISTPETGVDSIAISYALLDPIMTVFRPFAAVVTAFTAGIMENLFGVNDGGQKMEMDDERHDHHAGCGDNCHTTAPHDDMKAGKSGGIFAKIGDGMSFAFGDMFDDLAGWMAVGLVAAGVMNLFLPEDFFTGHLGGGLTVMLLMLVVGLPMYICASASTPIASAMIMKGMSPGTALVFLLAGPATNITSMAIVRKHMGNRSLFIYLATISACALAMGFALDGLYFYLGLNAVMSMGFGGEAAPGYLKTLGAVIFMVLFARYAAGWAYSTISRRLNQRSAPPVLKNGME